MSAVRAMVPDTQREGMMTDHNTPTLPPLPKPEWYFGHSTALPMYSEEEMREYGAACAADLAACRAALRELVECDGKLQQIITAGRANPHATKDWPQIHGRNVAAWAAARKLTGDGNE